MFGDDEEIRSDKDLAADYRAGMESQDRLIANMRAELDSKDGEIVRLRNAVGALMSEMPPTVHWRKCHDCGTIQLHAENISPYVNCRKCGSRDTRKVSQ